MLAGDLLLMSTTNAELIVARASTTRFEEVKRYTIASLSGVGASRHRRPARSSSRTLRS